MLTEIKAYLYAKWCIEETENKVPEYVKKQARAWLEIADGNFPEAYICEKTLGKIIKLLGIIIHPDLRAPMSEGMEDYAWFFIVATLCTKRQDGTRYYTTSLLEICRKNFKTFYAALLFILLMLTDVEFGRYFSVAPDLKLSSELKIAIRKIIKASPLLVDDNVFKILRSEIRCLLTDSEYTPLAYSEDKMDGKLANAWLCDEAGAMDNYPIEAMRSSQITLKNKLGIIISTQYPNDNNAMIDEVDISKKVLDGLIEDERRFSLLYEPNADLLVNDKWKTDDAVICQSNPVAVAHDYIFDEIKKIRNMAILYENKRENYLCKHNNIKYKGLGVEGFIDITKVQQCKIEENLDFWKGKRVYLGLDLSQTDDNTGLAMVCEDDGIVYAKVWGFMPSEKVIYKTAKEKVDYNRFIAKCECFSCGEEVIDYGFVEEFILNLEKTYGVEIMQLAYDRYNAISTVQKLENNAITCVEVKQHSSVLHSPTKWLKEMILSKLFRYDQNRLLEINFQNARCTEDTNLNKYVNKKKSSGKVDMVVALINALYLLEQENLHGNNGFICQVI